MNRDRGGGGNEWNDCGVSWAPSRVAASNQHSCLCATLLAGHQGPAPDLIAASLFTTYADSDFADDKDNGKSTNVYLVNLGTGAVSWGSNCLGEWR